MKTPCDSLKKTKCAFLVTELSITEIPASFSNADRRRVPAEALSQSSLVTDLTYLKANVHGSGLFPLLNVDFLEFMGFRASIVTAPLCQ